MKYTWTYKSLIHRSKRVLFKLLVVIVFKTFKDNMDINFLIKNIEYPSVTTCIQYLISNSTVDLQNELSKFYTDASYWIINHYELVDCSTYTEYQHSPDNGEELSEFKNRKTTNICQKVQIFCYMKQHKDI